MAIDYKQGNYPNYPYASESIATAGCGPCSVSDIVEVDPPTTAQWLTDHGYAYPHQGTIYEGIAACLTAFNGGGKMIARDQDGRTDNAYFKAWKSAIQNGQEGILLMHKVTSSYWTNGGHYIAIVGFSNGKYLVYDPASAVRTGWHAWGDFSGNVSALYTSTRLWKGNGKITVDGYWGKDTTTLAQKVFVTTVDGVVSNQNSDMRKFLPNCQITSWDFVSPLKLRNGSQLVKAIQKMLGVDVDGFFGIKTLTALQKFLRVDVDGFFGYNSVTAWQKWLNAQ